MSNTQEILCPPSLSYYKYQKEGVEFGRDKERFLIADQMGLGKENPISSLIPTPDGFVRMGDLKVGDFVLGSDGKPTKVNGVYPQGVKDVYRVHFRGGSYSDCGLEHLWTVRDSNFRRDGWMTLTTEELIKRGVKNKGGHNKYIIPLQGEAYFNDKISSSDAYLMGVILGDGSFLKTGNIVISLGSRDESIAIDNFDFSMFGKRNQRSNNVVAYRLKSDHARRLEAEYGLTPAKSFSKKIPERLFTVDIESRWSLLKGLMDTDGSCIKNRTTFHTISPELAKGVKRLVHSLGGLAIIRNYDRTKDGKSIEYQVNVKLNKCPFTTPFKKEAWSKSSYITAPKISIEKIEKIGEEESQCIAVEADDHLYQEGIWHTVTHNTVQAIGTINDNPWAKSILIICPSSLKINWERELDVWLYDRELSVGICNSNVLPKTDIVIVNYDKLSKLINLRLRDWDILIMDEAHYIKNDKAQRTKAVCGYRKTPPLYGKKTVLLTGTPMTNRPEDLWTICNYMEPDVFKQKWAFLHRYCDPKMKFGRWDFSGASNLEELNNKMSKWMIRRYKKDVLPELPDKQYSVVELKAMGNQMKLIKEEKKLTEFSPEMNKVKIKFDDTSRIRKELGESKVPQVVARLRDMLEETDEKIVVFAHHRTVIEEIYAAFGEDKAVRVYGGMSGKDKQASIDAFNNDPKIRLFVGSIKSAGVGITLVVSSTLVFAECSYVPSDMQQAEDRIHRNGQKSDSVNIHYFVFRDSLDANIAHSLADKEKVINKIG